MDVSNAGSLDNQIHLCVITPDGGIWHTIVSEAHDVKKLTNDNPGAFSRVGIATLLGELHVCGITPHDGNIWHTIRHLDGSWQPNFGRVKDQTSNPGTFVDVSGAGIAGAGELHVCVITVDGGIWHTIRHLDGNWQPFFGNVKSQAGNPGTFQRISIASVFNELHVCGVTADGGIWHTIRHADGSWLPFSDVKSQGGSNTGAFVDVGTTRMNDELHLCGITADGSIWHTVRHAAGWWELFENVTGQVDGQGRFLAVSITEFFEARRPPQVSIGDLSNSKVSFSVNVPATDLHGNYPIVSAGPYDLSIFSLRGSLKIQWMGGQGTTIVNPTAASVVVDCDMTGNTKMGDGQDFQISVLVTDQFGVSVSDQKTISINVIGNKGE